MPRGCLLPEADGGGAVTIAVDPGGPSKLVGHYLVGHRAVLLKV